MQWWLVWTIRIYLHTCTVPPLRDRRLRCNWVNLHARVACSLVLQQWKSAGVATIVAKMSCVKYIHLLAPSVQIDALLVVIKFRPEHNFRVGHMDGSSGSSRTAVRLLRDYCLNKKRIRIHPEGRFWQHIPDPGVSLNQRVSGPPPRVKRPSV